MIYIQKEISNIIKSINNYDVNLSDFNKYYNPYDPIIINKNNKYAIKHKYFHTIRNIDNEDLEHLRISYDNVKQSKGYYSRYTCNQALNILTKIATLDENAPETDLYINIKNIIQKNPNAVFFFGVYERDPIISKEKDIYNTDLGSLFISIDNKYKYKKQLINKKMLKNKEI